TANLAITAANASTLVNFSANAGGGILARNAAGVTISGNAKVALLDPASHANRTVLTTGSLSIAGSAGAWTGTLDIGGNDAVGHNASPTPAKATAATVVYQTRRGLKPGGAF